MEKQDLTLGYWKIRGLAFPIRAVLEHLQVPYNIEDYVQGEGPEFCRKEWLDKKFELGYDFPNLPYLESKSDNIKITETLAIIQYICNKYDKNLLGKNSADFAVVQQVGMILHGTVKPSFTSVCYRTGDRQELKDKSVEGFKQIVKFLFGDEEGKVNKSNKQYLLGDYITWPDLYFLETLDGAEHFTEGEIFQHYPLLKEYQERLRNLPNIKAWRESERFYQVPFNNKIAKLQ